MISLVLEVTALETTLFLGNMNAIINITLRKFYIEMLLFFNKKCYSFPLTAELSCGGESPQPAPISPHS